MGRNYSDFSLDLFSVEGKVAMITGANQGLGLAYAVALAKAGADIFIPHFTEDVAEVKAAVEAQGRRVGFIRGDLTKAEDRQAAVRPHRHSHQQRRQQLRRALSRFSRQ